MNSVKLISILLLVLGIAILSTGLIVYWFTDPIASWSSVLILFGILIMLGAIILLCISIHYELEQSLRELSTKS